MRAIKLDEEQKAALFDQAKFKLMPSYVFAQVMANKRNREYVIKHL